MHLRCLSLLLTCAILSLHGEDPQPISAALAGALRTSGLPAGADSVTVPFEYNISGSFTVEVLIDGKPMRLVLDSGSCITAFSPGTAQKLGLQAVGRSESATSASGERVAGQRVLTKRISLGDAWTENEPVFIYDMPPGMNGLLGVSTLADWDVRIDPANKKLTLFPAGKSTAAGGRNGPAAFLQDGPSAGGHIQPAGIS